MAPRKGGQAAASELFVFARAVTYATLFVALVFVTDGIAGAYEGVPLRARIEGRGRADVGGSQAPSAFLMCAVW